MCYISLTSAANAFRLLQEAHYPIKQQRHVRSGLVLGYKYFIIHSFLPLNFNDVLHTLLRGSGVLGLITNLCGTCIHKVTFILYFCFG